MDPFRRPPAGSLRDLDVEGPVLDPDGERDPPRRPARPGEAELTAARAFSAAAWILVAAAVLGFHPAMRLGVMAEECRQLADASSHGPELLVSIGAYDPGAPWAVAGLLLSVAYIGLWGFL